MPPTIKEQLRGQFKYLDIKAINKIKNLELKARCMVEGFLAGMHRSQYKGFSVEFAGYREYVPGDDLRYLDWKVYARSDRLDIKEYELETNMRTRILLDTSESMEYKSGEFSKLEIACFITAALSYLALSQQDSVSLYSFDKELKQSAPPRSGMGQLATVLGKMGMIKKGENKTDIAFVLRSLVNKITAKGLIIIISDLFDKPENVIEGLRGIKYQRHDLIVLHTMDEYEVQFPFQRMTLFDGLEQYPKVLVDPRPLRKAYLEEVENFCFKIRKACSLERIDYELITSSKPIDVALSKYLAKRASMRIWMRK